MFTLNVNQFVYQEDGSVLCRFCIPGQDADLALHLTRANLAQLMQQVPEVYQADDYADYWTEVTSASVDEEVRTKTSLGHHVHPIVLRFGDCIEDPHLTAFPTEPIDPRD